MNTNFKQFIFIIKHKSNSFSETIQCKHAFVSFQELVSSRKKHLSRHSTKHTPDKTTLHLFSGFNLVYYISFTVCYIYVQFAQYTVRV